MKEEDVVARVLEWSANAVKEIPPCDKKKTITLERSEDGRIIAIFHPQGGDTPRVRKMYLSLHWFLCAKREVGGMIKSNGDKEKTLTFEWSEDGKKRFFHDYEEMYLGCRNCIYYPICHARKGKCVK